MVRIEGFEGRMGEVRGALRSQCNSEHPPSGKEGEGMETGGRGAGCKALNNCTSSQGPSLQNGKAV